jgi:hypothetical protein
MDPKPGPKLIGHHATDPLRWPARSAAETVAGQIFSVEYDGIEYGGLPVKTAYPYNVVRQAFSCAIEMPTYWLLS